MYFYLRVRSLLILTVAVAIVMDSLWSRSLPLRTVEPSILTGTTITTGSGNGGVSVTISGGSTGSQSGSKGTTAPTTITIYVPFVTFHAGDSLASACVSYRTITMANSYAAQLELNNAQALWARYATLFQRCTPTQVAAAPPSPGTLASSMWQQRFEHLLPTPVFTIPPGFGVINIPSYLVTEGRDTVGFTDSTALGTLSIAASSTYSVSTDGGATFQGPFVHGYPWPTGGITLRWQRAGNTTVMVRQDWMARWSLDGQSGSFPMVVTTTSENFHVATLTALHLQSQF
ncbi:MAG: hypothetical protein ACP5O0_07000 [Acidimicrobiales bacterium]